MAVVTLKLIILVSDAHITCTEQTDILVTWLVALRGLTIISPVHTISINPVQCQLICAPLCLYQQYDIIGTMCFLLELLVSLSPLQHGTHGFPLGPSCMTYDPYRHVIFFGTNSGELKMFVHLSRSLLNLCYSICVCVQVRSSWCRTSCSSS